MSKKFLCSQKAEDKYRLLIEATKFEELRQNLAESDEKIQEMAATTQIQKAKIPELLKKIDHLKSARMQHACSMQLRSPLRSDAMRCAACKRVSFSFSFLLVCVAFVCVFVLLCL